MAALTIAELNALIEECGCCPMPRCCEPLIECRQGSGLLYKKGFFPPDGSSSASDDLPGWKKTIYLKQILRINFVAPEDVISDQYRNFGGGWVSVPSQPYVSISVSGSLIHDYVNAYDGPISGWVTGSDCEEILAVAPFLCEIGADSAFTEDFFSGYYNSAADSYNTFLETKKVYSYTDISGLETDAHLEWEALYTDAAAWQVVHDSWVMQHDAWTADQAAWSLIYDEWLASYDAWVNGGEIGDPPVEPDAFTDPEPIEPDAEPEALYPPCSVRTTITETNWEITSPGGVLTVTLVPSDSASPNPSTYYEDIIMVPIGTMENPEYVYEDEYTHEAWLAAADAWFATHMSFSGEGSSVSSEECVPLAGCRASAHEGPFTTVDEGSKAITFFQYRIKLNKCCGYSTILSGWKEVFFPQSYLDWEADVAALGSDDPVPPAPVDLNDTATTKQWLWTGTPPLCPQDSDSSTSEPPVDPYDHEPMWSPWSATVKVPAGQEGVVLLRRYWQQCYPNGLHDVMPDVMGDIDLSETP